IGRRSCPRARGVRDRDGRMDRQERPQCRPARRPEDGTSGDTQTVGLPMANRQTDPRCARPRRLIVFASAFLALVSLCPAARSEPIELKAAFFSSDRAWNFRAALKPIIDAVNADREGGLRIVLYSGGTLGRELAKQPSLVRDGVADIAFVVPGFTPELFPD